MFEFALRARWDDDALRLSASLAYYTLFAIALILLVATAIAGMVFGAEAVRGGIVGQLDYLIGGEGEHARVDHSDDRTVRPSRDGWNCDRGGRRLAPAALRRNRFWILVARPTAHGALTFQGYGVRPTYWSHPVRPDTRQR
ncbi:MAG: hypothetical protein LC776_09285 [Acidobacteria bacterium]|nr:hypothetical protein [Acidobacteriota bacterium]